MPALELAHWAKFEETFGPLTVHERLDAMMKIQTGEQPRWQKPRSFTEAELFDWLDAEARKN